MFKNDNRKILFVYKSLIQIVHFYTKTLLKVWENDNFSAKNLLY